MKRYEYKVLRDFFPSETTLNLLGQDGWLLVATVPPGGDAGKAFRHYVFVREIPNTVGEPNEQRRAETTSEG